MKVLLANKFFYDLGGPETVLFLTRDLLRERGHEVVDFAMDDPRNHASRQQDYFVPNVDLKTIRPAVSSIRTAVRFLDSRDAASRVRRLVRDERPDIAHLHGINHQLTPSIIRALHGEGVPVVMTLHDYKLVCPAYTMLAGGAVCERCTGGRFYRAMTTSCRGPARSTLLTLESYLQHRILRSYDRVALFLAPSTFLAAKYREMGFKHRIEVLPNPVHASVAFQESPQRDAHVLFVGRVVPEKGTRTLCLAAVAAGVRVKIAGDGPQLEALRVEFAAMPQIEFLGRTDPAETRRLMAQALAVAVPSEWYENQSMVVLEALASGTPVIASAIGGNPELVIEGETGWLHAPGDVAALAGVLRRAAGDPEAARAVGRRAAEFAHRFAPELYYDRLIAIYRRVLGAGRVRGATVGAVAAEAE
jgi:glycosyltransferase involved in cell wall biosynthesis